MKLVSKDFEFPHKYACKRQKASSLLTTLTHTHSSAMHCQHMLTTEGKFNFMTHLKYRHLNVDILFIRIAIAIIPFLTR